MRAEYRDISVNLGGAAILKNISVDIEEGKITGIVGPNGCGKSTLIKTTFGLCPYQKGEIYIEGEPVKKIGKKRLASMLGYVGQDNNSVFDFSVYDVLSMAVHTKKSGRQSSKELIEGALEELNISHLKDRGIQTLSGGERKMVFIARTIVQQVDTIILDEPTNHLDICHQLFIMDYLKRSKKTILIVLHDLRLAAHYCDILYMMNAGESVCHGRPENVLTTKNVKDVFGISGEAAAMKTGGLDFNLYMH